MPFFRYIIILIAFTSCGAIVDYDYETNTDFSTYKTYNYFTDMTTGFSQLDNKRLINAIDTKLATMGFTKSDTPTFRIDIQSGEMTTPTHNNVGIGIGGTGRNVGGGVSIGIPIGGNRTRREISIEFVDDSKNGVFWQAITSMSQLGNTPDQREAAFTKLINTIFKAYPPKKDN